MKQRFSRFLTLVLSLLMVFYVFPYNAIGAQVNSSDADSIREEQGIITTEKEAADTTTEGDIEIIDAPANEPSYVLHEMEGLREEKVKHYRLSDGSYAAIEFPESVHYLDEDENFEDIDNTLTEADLGYTTSAGTVEYIFSDNFETDQVLYCGFEDHSVSVSFNGNELSAEGLITEDLDLDINETDDVTVSEKSIEIINPGDEREDENGAVTYSLGETSSEEEGKLSLEEAIERDVKNESSIKYVNISEGIDLRYDIIGNNLKEYIILKEKPDTGVFSFGMSFENLVPVLNGDKSISLTDGTGTEIFNIPAPYMIDADNIISEDCEYILEAQGEGYILKVTVSEDWLNDEDRVYPVMIDPALVLSKFRGEYNTDISTAYYAKGTGTLYTPGNGVVFMGYDSQSEGEYLTYMKVNSLPALPFACMPTRSYMYLGQDAFDKAAMTELTVSARRADSVSGWYSGYADNDILDYTVLSDDTTGKYVSWDVTEASKEWYENASTNTGIVFVSEESFTDTNCAKATFIGYNNADFYANSQPKFIVYYLNTVGIEDRFSYTTQSIGNAGTGYLRILDGEYTLIRTDAVYDSVAMPVSINHVYNSRYWDDVFTGSENLINTKDYSQMLLGRGWKLSIQQTLIGKQIPNASGGEDDYLIYTDGDGTEHYMYHDSKTGSYIDEEGFGLTVIINNTVDWSMKDKKDNWWIFKNGYLYQMQDANSNTITIRYGNSSSNSVVGDGIPSDTRNRIIEVVAKNAGSSVEKKVAVFSYTDRYLMTITDYSGRVTSLNYTNNGYLSYFKSHNGYYMKYHYDATNRLKRVYDNEIEYGVDYSFDSKGKVGGFCEFVCDRANEYGTQYDELGARYWLNTYNDGTSYIRYEGSDRTANTADDIVSTYLFDNYGRTVNSYSTNRKPTDTYVSNYIIYGTSATEYTPTTTTEVKKNNRIAMAASTGGVSVNRLMNPGAENALNNWEYTTSKVSASTDHARTGLKSFKLTGTASGEVRVAQTRKLYTTGKYTASAYIKVSTISSTNADIALYVYDSQGNYDKSRVITEVTPSGIWERISVTFDAEINKYYRVELKAVNTAATIYADDFQLEAGEGASRVNILENGDFEYSNTEWNMSENTGSIVSETNNCMPGGTHSYKLTAGAGEQKQAEQTVNINGDSSAETYIFSGWAKAKAVPFRTEDEDTSKLEAKFKLYAKVTYTGTSLSDDWYQVNFDPAVQNEWQYVSLMIAPKQNSPIKDITVGICYANNNGSAYFDNLSLIREDVQTYKYDGNGELEKVGSSTKDEETSYSYEGADLMTATFPGSGTYDYTYKTSGNKHLVTSVKCDDLIMSLDYNASGSNTYTRLTGTSGKQIYSEANYTADGDHISSSIDGNGISSVYTYNTKGQLSTSKVQSSSTMANGGDVVTNYTYDSIGRNTDVYITGTVSLKYNYIDGQISGITRGGYIEGNSTKQEQSYSFTYNKWGSTVVTKIGTQTLAEYSYGAKNGNLIRMDYGNGNSDDYITYEYDSLDRIIKVKYNGVDRYTYTYNGDGSLYSAAEYRTNSAGTTVHTYYYNYDGIGRLVGMSIYEGDKLIGYQTVEFDSFSRTSTSTEKSGDNRVTNTYTYDNDNGLTTSVSQSYKAGFKNATNSFAYSYDALKRVNSVTVTHDGTSYVESYEYADNLNNSSYTSNLISKKSYDAMMGDLSSVYDFEYEYDNVGNIKSADTIGYSDNSNDGEVRYFYDEQNQLIMECNDAVGETYMYEYDTYGNIRSKYIVGTSNFNSYDAAVENRHLFDLDIIRYSYTNSNWKDQLTAFNGTAFTYDNIGNPLTYYNGNSYSFTWQNGRELYSSVNDGKTVYYAYNIDGLRTIKTVIGGERYLYYYSGDRLISMTWEEGAKSLNFLYNGDTPYSVVYKYTEDGVNYSSSYYYITNLQGDVVALMNANHAIVAEYTYDAWGNILAITDNLGNDITGNASHIANLNPIRYRGYYYDTETGFYYLQSRYYDPAIKRFISADGYMSTGQGFAGCNMYAYCGNNPVGCVDGTGKAPLKVSRHLLFHWLVADGSDLIMDKYSHASRALKKSKTMKKKIEKEIEKYEAGEDYGTGYVTFGSNETDLWLAARNASYEMSITKEIRYVNFLFFESLKTRYVIEVTVFDTYDFNKGDETGDGLGSKLNNIGYKAQEADWGTAFYWEANYVYKTDWEKGL